MGEAEAATEEEAFVVTTLVTNVVEDAALVLLDDETRVLDTATALLLLEPEPLFQPVISSSVST